MFIKWLKNSNIKFRAGFALAEMLMVVAILAVLAGVAIPGIITIQRNLEMMRLDESAKAIYVAAQNRLSGWKVSGEIVKLDITGKAIENQNVLADFEDIESATLSFDDGQYYYMASDDDTVRDFFPAGALDSSFYEGKFIIEYNTVTGMVYGVFYADAAFVYDRVDGGLPRDREERSDYSPRLGYYGGADIEPVTVDELEADFVLVNDEHSLRAEVVVDPRQSERQYTVTVGLKGAPNASSTRTYILGTDWGMNDDQISYELIDAATGKYTIILDSHANGTDWQFKTLFAENHPTSGRSAIVPGEDVTVTLKVEAQGSMPAEVSKSANSLFARVTDAQPVTGVDTGINGTPLKTAFIQNARHLQNLDTVIGFGTNTNQIDSGIQAAELISEIDWAVYGENDGAGTWTDYLETFTSISSMDNGATLVSFNGNGNIVRNMDAPLLDSPEGSGGDPGGGRHVANLRLVNPKITTVGTAGALARRGAAVTYTNCGAYAETETRTNPATGVTETGIFADTAYVETTVTTANDFVGGLVGSLSGNMNQCYAALTRIEGHNATRAGGLVGQINGTIAQCYADNGVWGLVDGNGTEGWLPDTGLIVSYMGASYSYYGGLVGYFSGGYQVNDSYSAGILRFNVSSGNAVISGFCSYGAAVFANCYSATDFEMTGGVMPANGINGFAQGASGTYAYLVNGIVNGDTTGEKTCAQIRALTEPGGAFYGNSAWSAGNAASTKAYGQTGAYPLPRVAQQYHYGDWAYDEIEPEIVVVNDNASLRAEVTVQKPVSARWKFTLDVTESGTTKTKTIVLKRTGNQSHVTYDESAGAEKYTIVLDSHAEGTDWQFKTLFGTGEVALTPGKDIGVTFRANGANEDPAEAEAEDISSLFASKINGTAVVTNARHLQNLSAAASPATAGYYSGLNFAAAGITSVELGADIDWNDTERSGTSGNTAVFSPIQYNSGTSIYFKRFDGNHHKIYNLTSALFHNYSTSGARNEITDVNLVNPKITHTTGSHGVDGYVGVLANSASAVNIQNCHVYAEAEGGSVDADTAYLVSTGKGLAVGGLVGFSDGSGLTISDSSVSLTKLQVERTVSASYSIGGILGYDSSGGIMNTTITRSYANIGVWGITDDNGTPGDASDDTEDWLPGSGLIAELPANTNNNIGGLAAYGAAVNYSYASGIIRAQTLSVGSKVGGVSTLGSANSVHHSYSVIGYDISGSPAVYGTAPGAGGFHNYYLRNAALPSGNTNNGFSRTYAEMLKLLDAGNPFHGDTAWTAANAASTYEYGMTAPEGEPVYPFPRLTSQDHYGDWPKEKERYLVGIGVAESDSFAIDNHGQLYGWGYNPDGETGIGSASPTVNTPTISTVAADIQFRSVTGGRWSSAGIDYDGNLYTWGFGLYGTIGHGDSNNQLSPKKITFAGEPTFKEVALFSYGGLALTQDGELWVWGYHNMFDYGIHGDGSNVAHNAWTPVKMANFSGTTIVDIAANSFDVPPSALALDSNGNIWGWGDNEYGNLGLADDIPRNSPVKIYDAATGRWTAVAGDHLTAGTKMASVEVGWGMGGAMDENGSIYSWGSNIQSDLGLGQPAGGSSFPPKRVYNALAGDWTAPGIADFTDGSGNPAPRRMVYFTVAIHKSFVIDEQGNAYAWGFNGYGQLGVGTQGNTTSVVNTNQTTPTQIYNASTGLFIGGESLPAGTKIFSIAGQQYHTLLLAGNGEIFASGYDDHYELGNGLPLETRNTFINISGAGDLPAGSANLVSPMSLTPLEMPEEESAGLLKEEPEAPEDMPEPPSKAPQIPEDAPEEPTDDTPGIPDDVPELPSDTPTDAPEEPTDDTPGVADDVPELPSDAPTDASEEPTDDTSEVSTGASEQLSEAPKTPMDVPERPFDESAGSAGILETPGSDTAEGSQTEPIGGGSDQAILNSRQTRKAIRTAARRRRRKTVTRRSGGPDADGLSVVGSGVADTSGDPDDGGTAESSGDTAPTGVLPKGYQLSHARRLTRPIYRVIHRVS